MNFSLNNRCRSASQKKRPGFVSESCSRHHLSVHDVLTSFLNYYNFTVSFTLSSAGNLKFQLGRLRVLTFPSSNICKRLRDRTHLEVALGPRPGQQVGLDEHPAEMVQVLGHVLHVCHVQAVHAVSGLPQAEDPAREVDRSRPRPDWGCQSRNVRMPK